MKFFSGYNLLLKREEIPEGFEKMSIIQLLRNTKFGVSIPKNVAIVGLDTLLLSSENSRECTRYLMTILRTNNKIFRKQENTFLFVPQDEMSENSNVYCKKGDKRVCISSIFASRLHINDVGVYYADFEF